MSNRLPTPGGDDGDWGTILNSYLGVSLSATGTLLTSAVSAAGGELTSNKGAASGYAPLNSSSIVPTANLGTGTASSSNYLRGDSTWTAAPSAPNATTSTPGLVQLAGDLAGSGSSATAPTLLGTTNVESIITANTTVAGALQASGNLSTVADTGSARANLHVPALTPAAAVSTTNITTLTTSGTPTVDGYSLASGDLVLLTGQTNVSPGVGIQNGLWLIPSSGAWTRPTEFASGATIKGRSVAVLNGTAYANTVWVLDAATAGLVIDTAAQTWTSTTVVGTAANETMIRANTLNQLAAPTTNLSLNSQRIINLANGIANSDMATINQTYDPIYGDGSDGSPTFDGTTTILGIGPVSQNGFSNYVMGRDLFLASPAFYTGVALLTQGFRLFINGTVTINGSVMIAAQGIVSNGGQFLGPTYGGFGFGAGTVAGAQGGTNGGTGAGASTSALTNSLGGAGGAGGAGTTAGASAGTVTAPTAASGSVRSLPTAAFGAVLSTSTGFTAVNGGTGGASGGGSGGTGTGGPGGAGATVLVAAIQYVSLLAGATLTLSAQGGTGGAAQGSGNSGGGGGGGGGVVICISKNLSSITTSVAGGAGGAKTGTGTAGSAGSAGTAILIPG